MDTAGREWDVPAVVGAAGGLHPRDGVGEDGGEDGEEEEGGGAGRGGAEALQGGEEVLQ